MIGHVTITNPHCWPHVRRGSEALIHGLASWLGGQGVRTEIVAGGPASRSYRIDDVAYTTVRARDLSRLTRDLDTEVTSVPAMAWRLRMLAPDLVHSFLFTDAFAAQLARRPYVISYGGIALRSSMRGHPLRTRMFWRASRGARRIVCPSAAAATHLQHEFGLTAEVIANGLDVSRFANDVDAQPGRIFCAATPNDARKRPEVLVDALALLVARGVDAHVVFAGAVDGSRRDALRGRLPDAACDRLSFAGELDEQGVAAEYAQAAVTCLPSLNEAFGMVVVESLAAGTPVVGTNHGAIPELLTSEVGRTFAPDDVSGCADAIEQFLGAAGDPRLRADCRQRAQRYDWSQIGPKYLDLYDRVA